jgi:hypothetical protein
MALIYNAHVAKRPQPRLYIGPPADDDMSAAGVARGILLGLAIWAITILVLCI